MNVIRIVKSNATTPNSFRNLILNFADSSQLIYNLTSFIT